MIDMTPEWISSPEAFKRNLEEQRDFNSSVGLTELVISDYQQSLFAGSSREDAFQDATANLGLKNHATWEYARGILENHPGPEEV
jgi:hypothetical protein